MTTLVTAPDLGSLVLVLAASTAGAILSRAHRRVVLPTAVVEIVLGILIGSQVLDIAKPDAYIEFLSNIGLVFLFFFAGLEVIEKHVPRRSLVRGTGGWAISLAIGLTAGLLLEQGGLDAEGWLLGVALATTALGTLVPILSDAGLTSTPFGRAVLGTGVAGEFWPIVVISVFLTGVYGAAAEVILLIVFSGLVALAAAAAVRARPPRVVRVLRETIHTTGQAAVRLTVFRLAALVWIANGRVEDVAHELLGGLRVDVRVGSSSSSTGASVIQSRALAVTAAPIRARPPRVVKALRRTTHTTGQAAVRLTDFLLAALMWRPTSVWTSCSARSRLGSSSGSRSTRPEGQGLANAMLTASRCHSRQPASRRGG